MDIITEAAQFMWLQQTANASVLQAHLGISYKNTLRVLQRLADLGVVTVAPNQTGVWLPTPMPQHFFQKKGRSLYRRLTMYKRPKEGAEVVGVIGIGHTFLTHHQQSDWWLVCDHLGCIGYINVDALKFVHLD